MDTIVFDDIKVALQGTVVLPTPRVSRETIISVLQTHTDLIMSLRKDHQSLYNKVLNVEAETKNNRSSIEQLEEDNRAIRADVTNLYRLSDEFRKEMDELSQKVAELYVLKKQMADQKEYVEELATKFTNFHEDVNTYMTENTKQVNRLQLSSDETQFQLKEMKDYVDHFADNLVLNSQQIMVDVQAGFNSKPISLTDVLKQCTNNFNDINDVNKVQGDQITKIFSDLDTKAPDTVLFNISTLEKKVATIELHIKKEEEQGMGALRKTCEELTIHMQSMQTELADKIDRESVGFIVHEKYEEIVRYLQDALQSSLEDENNFKEKADEIQEMVVLLSNSKADRSEIANMQEIMVKSEALLKKVGSQANIKEKMKDMITRKELEAMMSMKVDKVDFEHQLQNALVNGRKARKMQSLSTGLHPIQDEAMALSHSLPNLHHVGINDHHHVLSMSVHDQSPPSSANNLGMPRSGRAGSPPTLQNGVMHIDPPANGPNGNASMQPVPVIAIGQSLGGGSPGRGTRGSSDFSQFVKAKGPKGGKAGNLPSADIPGAFRKATEGNRAGGQLKPTGASPNPEGYGRSEYPYTDPNYNMPYSEQSAMTDHLAYIHGPLVGGGFNARSAHILRSLPGNKTIPGEDVEGKGLMLKGADGHMYYQDLQPN